jgi:penicillin amidase
MKTLRKWLIGVGIALLVIMLILASVVVGFVRHPWPQVKGTIRVSGLSAPVEVIRDRWGVPHIYAQNEHDLFFAQGYVHAQDRLWQMEIGRRMASGTLSEIIGQATLSTDRQYRWLGLRRVAEQSWTELDDDSRAILESYAEGVNAYIESHRNRLPLEFTVLQYSPEPWTPIDSLTWTNMVASDTTGHQYEELEYARLIAKIGEAAAQQLIPPRDEDTPTIIPSAASSYDWLQNASFGQESADLDEWTGGPMSNWGSNNWVASGSRTTTGMPILANDTHLWLVMPSLWYENGLHGGRFDSVGFSFPGVPLVVIGHNQHIAWGTTTLRADDQDNYIETMNAGRTQYEFMGEWYPLERIQETIKVKGRGPARETISFTRHGPFRLSPNDGSPIALRWTLYEGNPSFGSVVLLNLATNWDEFRAALQHWNAPAQNFVYADVEGNIGYQAAGQVPIRVPGHDGRVPVPGSTGEYEWQGYIPFDELPTAFNPPTGFIVTANNKIVPDDYPYLISSVWNPGYRAERITALLSADDTLSVEDMQGIQGDTYSRPAETLRPYLLAVEPENELQAEALAQLEAWDLYVDADSVGASIYEVWFVSMVRNTVGDELGEQPPAALWLFGRPNWLAGLLTDADNSLFDDIHSPSVVETRDDIVRRSLADAVNWLSENYGENPNRWEWGKLHTLTLVHRPFGQSGIAPLERLFNSGMISSGGDPQTVNNTEYIWLNQQFATVFGTSQRMIVDVSNWDSSLAINSTGQSGHLLNPHRQDQISMWRDAQYHPMVFSREAVEEHAKAVLTLTPQQ